MLTIALASAASRFSLDKPFTLDVGSELAGPGGIHLRYTEAAPTFAAAAAVLPRVELRTQDGPATALWPVLLSPGLPDGALGRGWWQGLEVTTLAVEPDPFRATFEVSRHPRHRHEFAWDTPFRAVPGELWVSPDAHVELVQTGVPGGETFAAELSVRRGEALSSVIVHAGQVVGDGDLLFAATPDPAGGRVWVRAWRPAETVRTLVPGEVVRLWSGERARGAGLEVQVSQLGNMWFHDGRPEQIFGTVTITRGGRAEGAEITTASPTATLFDGAVVVTVGNLSAARFDGNAPVEVRVEVR